ncbi:MAG: GerAB/ArcD/ProY family transporter, partial [Clostridia bacterium]
QQHLFLWMQREVGSWFAWIITVPIMLELFLMCTMTMRDVAYWTNITYLPTTPNIVIVSLLAFVCFYAVHSGIRSIAIVNGILLPFVFLLGFFVATANIPEKKYSLLFPLLEHGYPPVLHGMMYAASGFIGIFYIVYLQHRLKTAIRLSSLFYTAAILIILTLGPLMAAIAIFGPFEAARMRFPAFEEWRIVTFGHFLEHVDFLSIYQWLVGSFTRISLGMFLIPDLLGVGQGKKRTWLLIGLFVLLIGISQIPISDKQFMDYLAVYYLPVTCLFNILLSIILYLVSWKTRKEKVEA